MHTHTGLDKSVDRATVLTWTIITASSNFKIRTGLEWDPTVEATAAGMLNTYFSNESSTTATKPVRLDRTALFEGYAKGAASKIRYVVTTAPQSGTSAEHSGNFFVDSNDGSTTFLPSNRDVQQHQYTGTLLAVDAAGSEVVVFQWEFKVNPERVFRTRSDWDPNPRNHSPAVNLLARYTTDQTYKSEKLQHSREQLFEGAMNNDIGAISFKIDISEAASPGSFLVGSEGETLFNPKEQGNYSARLVAVDSGGRTANVFVWRFAVNKKKKFAVTKDWQDKKARFVSSDIDAGYRTKTYAASLPVKFGSLPKRDALFQHFAGKDASRITYAMTFTQRSCTGTCCNSSSPGEFYVRDDGKLPQMFAVGSPKTNVCPALVTLNFD